MPFELVVVTPQGESFRGAVESVVLPGAEGEFGVLPSHERLLTPLKIGAIEIRIGSEMLYGAIAEGFAEVRGEEVAVLVDSCELAGEIDVARAELAKSRAEQDLSRLGTGGDAERYAQFEGALERAQNRIEVSQKKG